jgi:2-oxoglutarate dehydrogenase E1 component
MLLPHGYMGQGAEHSSCRVERFLQQVDEDPEQIPKLNEEQRMVIQQTNWQVINCTTPANYFHVLRRQVHRNSRKPLILVTPKNLLRDKRCTSTLEDMGIGSKFHRIFPETDPEIAGSTDKVRRLMFVSGKFYYDIIEEREKRGLKDVAVVRIEQLAPFPWDRVAQECKKYKNADVMWVQEEPKNMGAWSFVQPRICAATRGLNGEEKRPLFAGRVPSAATATGLGSRAHNAETTEILEAAFTFGKK